MRVATLAAIGAGLVLAPAAFAATPGNSWRLDLNGGVVQRANVSQQMTFAGQGVVADTGRVGGAVEFTSAPSFATVAESEDDNPGTSGFAIRLVFTTRSIPSQSYSGNLMQKGRFGDAGQVKLQLVPAGHGTVNCRVEGTSGAKMITSDVVVDNGAWHTAACWRNGNTVGLTVDGVVTSLS